MDSGSWLTVKKRWSSSRATRAKASAILPSRSPASIDSAASMEGGRPRSLASACKSV
jgi:hypothetical protein